MPILPNEVGGSNHGSKVIRMQTTTGCGRRLLSCRLMLALAALCLTTLFAWGAVGGGRPVAGPRKVPVSAVGRTTGRLPERTAVRMATDGRLERAATATAPRGKAPEAERSAPTRSDVESGRVKITEAHPGTASHGTAVGELELDRTRTLTADPPQRRRRN
jgi:hypothetical protein